MSQSPNWFVLIIPFCIGLFIAGLFFFRRYTGLSRGAALMALGASVIGCALHIIFRIRNMSTTHHVSQNVDSILATLAAGACIVLMAAFAFRLWGRWVDEKATPEERQPGLPGVRAWFGVANVVVGAAIVLLAWFGFDISPVLGAVGVGGLLAAYPLMRMEGLTAGAPPPAAREDLSAEREKIVSMLEAGKLTPDESAELLQALGESSRPAATRQVPLTGSQRTMLIGAALVIVGFFLPWFVFNVGREATRLMSQMHGSVGLFGGTVEMPQAMIPGGDIKTPSVTVSGGDIRRGLGWITLVLASIAAFLPYLGSSLDAATQRMIRLLALGSGSIIVLYLLTQNIRFVGIGLIAVTIGYALEIAGALRIPPREKA
jgi:SHOCT-like domain